MKILTLHCDYIKFKAEKKALKSAEPVDSKQVEVKDNPLVVLTAIESGDSDSEVSDSIKAIKTTAKEVKAKSIVLYPYAHLSSNLANPETALKLLKQAETSLKKDFKVTRAPFGYYKSFELKCKGHPLAELSKEFGDSKVIKASDSEKSYDPKQLLREVSRSRLDTSKLKENDHRILGQNLDLFSFNEVSPGSVFWHNNGLIIYNELIKFWREMHEKAGYKEVSTPQVLDNKLWKISGHWKLYKENMFLTNYENRDFAVKPMNCPGSMIIYKSKTRSYKDLPLRLSEIGLVHRQELSGVLAGLFRLIQFTQDDAHIFCTEKQLQDEITNVIKLFQDILNKFNFKEYRYTISTRSKEKKDKYLGDDKIWKAAEDSLAKGLKKLKIKFDKEPGEAKFYGPSLDVQIKDSLGREWQCATLQLDFNLAPRFELEYIDKDNKSKTPIVLHRVVLGSIERFIGILLEHLSGALPLWLSPVQLRVLNFTDRNEKATEKIALQLKSEIPQLRIETDLRSTTVGEKVRDAEMQKIPYIIVIGDKEEESQTLAVRERGSKPKFKVKLSALVTELQDKIENRS